MNKERAAELLLKGIEAEIERVCSSIRPFNEADYNNLANLLAERKEAKESYKTVRLDKE